MADALAQIDAVLAEVDALEASLGDVSVDMREKRSRYEVRVSVPNASDAKVDVKVKGGHLHLKVRQGSQKSGGGGSASAGFLRQESHVEKVVPLPGPVDEGRMRSQWKDGTLTILIPKATA